MEDPEKSHAQSHKSYMKDPEKSCADSAARSRKRYKKDLEKSCDDSAALRCESYLKGPEKSCAKNHESYMKDPKRVMLTVQHEATKVTRMTWRRVVMIVLHGAVRVT